MPADADNPEGDTVTRKPDRWINENIIRRTGGKPSYRPAPRPYVPDADDAAPDPRPFAAWTDRCEADGCPAAPRIALARMIVHRHLDWPNMSAASVQTRCLCRHHGDSVDDDAGWVEIAVRALT